MYSSKIMRVGSSEPQSQSAESAHADETFSPAVDEDVFDQLRGLPEILSEKVC